VTGQVVEAMSIMTIAGTKRGSAMSAGATGKEANAAPAATMERNVNAKELRVARAVPTGRDVNAATDPIARRREPSRRPSYLLRTKMTSAANRIRPAMAM